MGKRIISLVPSLTQTVAQMGLRDEIVGCTQFCVDPPGLHRHVTLVGGTKDPSIEKIRGLKPTHILVNSEENPPEAIAQCLNLASVLETFPKTLDQVPSMLCDLGNFLDSQPQAIELSQQLTTSLDQLKKNSPPMDPKFKMRRFLYFIWRNPYMIAGHDTYISSVLEFIGWTNAAPKISPPHPRYPQLSLEDLQKCDADLILLSTEPYPFRRRDALRLQREWPTIPEIYKINGKLMSWYGGNSLDLVDQLNLFCSGNPDFINKLED